MNNSTAVAAYEPGPEQESAIAVIGGSWSPEEFMKRIEREKQMRQILKDYVKSELKAEHHYSDHIGNQQLNKPMLLQEGARAIAAIFGLFFGEPSLKEEQLEDGHFRVRAHIGLFSQSGNQITSGDGLCTSRETKYAFRKSDRECPNCNQPRIRKSKFPPRNDPNAQPGWYCSDKDGGCGQQFAADDKRISEQVTGRVDNPDLADVENTVLKMAIKRAKVAAVCDIPTVSEIFAPEGDPKPVTSSSPQQGKGSPAARNGGSASREPSPAPPTKVSAVERASNLWAKLVEKGAEVEDLTVQFLPEGVASIDAVDEEYAASIIEPLSNLLNAKLKQSN